MVLLQPTYIPPPLEERDSPHVPAGVGDQGPRLEVPGPVTGDSRLVNATTTPAAAATTTTITTAAAAAFGMPPVGGIGGWVGAPKKLYTLGYAEDRLNVS